jgi:hypothetical protein
MHQPGGKPLRSLLGIEVVIRAASTVRVIKGRPAVAAVGRPAYGAHILRIRQQLVSTLQSIHLLCG